MSVVAVRGNKLLVTSKCPVCKNRVTRYRASCHPALSNIFCSRSCHYKFRRTSINSYLRGQVLKNYIKILNSAPESKSKTGCLISRMWCSLVFDSGVKFSLRSSYLKQFKDSRRKTGKQRFGFILPTKAIACLKELYPELI